MPRKKGLGRDIEKSVDTMTNLLAVLKEFSKMPLKRGLQSNGARDEKLLKMVNDASAKAHDLSIIVEDLRDDVRDLKTNKNSRFACRRVMENFIKASV